MAEEKRADGITAAEQTGQAEKAEKTRDKKKTNKRERASPYDSLAAIWNVLAEAKRNGEGPLTVKDIHTRLAKIEAQKEKERAGLREPKPEEEKEEEEEEAEDEITIPPPSPRTLERLLPNEFEALMTLFPGLRPRVESNDGRILDSYLSRGRLHVVVETPRGDTLADREMLVLLENTKGMVPNSSTIEDHLIRLAEAGKQMDEALSRKRLAGRPISDLTFPPVRVKCLLASKGTGKTKYLDYFQETANRENNAAAYADKTRERYEEKAERAAEAKEKARKAAREAAAAKKRGDPMAAEKAGAAREAALGAEEAKAEAEEAKLEADRAEEIFNSLKEDNNRTRYFSLENLLTPSQGRILSDLIKVYPYIGEDETTLLLNTLEKVFPGYSSGGGLRYAFKQRTDNLFKNLSELDRAIRERQCVSLQYGEYALEGQGDDLHPVLRIRPGSQTSDREKACGFNKKQGSRLFEPYALMWSNGYYYLVGKHQTVVNLRVDRILSVGIMSGEKYRVQPPRDFDPVEYRDRSPVMYPGTPEFIRLRCHRSMVSVVMDFFGTQAEYRPARTAPTKDYMEVRLYVAPAGVKLFAMQYADRVEVLEPPALRQEMADSLRAASVKYGGQAGSGGSSSAP